MNKKSMMLTTSQFAKLHNVNRRTLHYYDDIGLFSPMEKGENGYRYYHISQSLGFEYIRMLKELGMSIEELADYCKNPSPERFMKLACEKEREIELEIERLKNTKKILSMKKEQLSACEGLSDCEIRVEETGEAKLSVLPYEFDEDSMTQMFLYLKDKWSVEQIRRGIGSIISLDKVETGDFSGYDGFFTYAAAGSRGDSIITMPAGKYLCGYHKGSWDEAPLMYKKMLGYADEKGIRLSGYAYEMGLNEFAISDPQDYVTKFMIYAEA
mgnify:FL=1